MTTVSINSSPSNAEVEMQDYAAPDRSWYSLGNTPLQSARIFKGNFRWKVSKSGFGVVLAAPFTTAKMNFNLDAARRGPAGMVLSPGGSWSNYVAFVGWQGPFKLPPYYIDRHEVTNRDYEVFVDSGGYQNQKLWPTEFMKDGHKLSWDEAMPIFRDVTGRPGPSTWTGGHYPQGQGDFPVTGLSWFEAAAYATFVGKSLPVLAQWEQFAPSDQGPTIVQASNIAGHALAPVESYKGLGPFGTYDAAGNAREWIANTVDDDMRFILGGSWRSPIYLYYTPEVASPYDRSDTNGFRCVQNLAPLPPASMLPVHRVTRDFTHFKPASDSIFNAYKLLYDYSHGPLNATSAGIVSRDCRLARREGRLQHRLPR